MSAQSCYGHLLGAEDPLLDPCPLPPADSHTRFVLQRNPHGKLELTDGDRPKVGALRIDFGDRELARRIKAGRQQPLARACGLNQPGQPRILDATAGLGRDAFCLAALGAEVLMFERHPVLHAMLHDALQRLPRSLASRLSLLPQDSLLAAWPTVDTIYLDPMFPSEGKRAAPGLEMQYLQAMIGADEDAQDLWEKALQADAGRVVLKRPPRGARVRLGEPDASFGGGRVVYDVYLLASRKATGEASAFQATESGCSARR